MKNIMAVTPELLEKIDKAHAVSTSIMKEFKEQEPAAAALAKFNPVSQTTAKEGAKQASTSSASSKAPKSSVPGKK